MKCPACPTISLVMTERSGIEIDYCPDCRGVWLDRGELDKIIERAAPTPPAPLPTPPPPPSAGPYSADVPVPAGRAVYRERFDDDFDDDRDDDFDDRRRSYPEHRGDGRPSGKRRKKSLLGELFDF